METQNNGTESMTFGEEKVEGQMQAGVENVQTPQQQSVAPSPFTSQGLNNSHQQKVLKKPMKAGWIITLVMLVLSLIGVGVGTAMTVSTLPTLITDLEKENGKYPIESVEGEMFTINSLKAGKEYIFILSQSTNPRIESVTIDGQKPHAVSNSSSGGQAVVFYTFTAKADTAELTLNGFVPTSDASVIVADGEVYMPKLMSLGIGVIIAAIAGFIGFISFVLFLIFLIIFLVKNSKYKQQMRMA